MDIQASVFNDIKTILDKTKARLVAVSKTKPTADIMGLYDLGHRDFGENYVQELLEKSKALPKDIRWHYIGHLQGNKAKMIVPFVFLIHGVDSMKLLVEISKQALKAERKVDCLIQVHIAKEETKFGFDVEALDGLFGDADANLLKGVKIKGLMGMATATDDRQLIRNEFKQLKKLYDRYARYPTPWSDFNTLSMGMSSDYDIALEEGSNLVRIGSLLFGNR